MLTDRKYPVDVLVQEQVIFVYINGATKHNKEEPITSSPPSTKVTFVDSKDAAAAAKGVPDHTWLSGSDEKSDNESDKESDENYKPQDKQLLTGTKSSKEQDQPKKV